MLRQRLNSLRRQAGAEPEVTRPSSPTGLADRIDRLRPKGGGEADGSPVADDAALAARLGGAPIAPGVILLERAFPLRSLHGRYPLRPARRAGVLPELADVDGDELLFFDTETTGLAGGSGTVAFMLGMGRVVGERFVVRQYLLTNFAGEGAMLRAAGEWLNGCTALVSFNGRSFDAPLLATRYRLQGLADPFATRPHVDLLAPTRRAFSHRWEDCRLGTAERELLGFHREDDLPGAEAPAAWLDYLRRGEAGRLPGVARHNEWDILSLAVLLALLDEVHEAPLRWRGDARAIARAYMKGGDDERAFRLLREGRGALDDEGLLELARQHRRRGEWGEARAIWEALAKGGRAEALEYLAKYHEHQRRDYRAAMGYARRLPGGEASERRRGRLARKLGEGMGVQSSLF